MHSTFIWIAAIFLLGFQTSGFIPRKLSIVYRSNLFPMLYSKIDDQLLNITMNLELLLESIKETNMQLNRRDQQQDKIDKQIQQLTGYNQNQDASLEYVISRSLKSYLLDSLCIPDECIREINQKVIYDPTTCIVAVEWDSIFIIDYTDLIPGSILRESWPPNNTLILLEVKEKANTTTIFENLPSRINKTLTMINMDESTFSTPKKFRDKLAYQRGVFSPTSNYIVAIGGRNVHDEVEEAITNQGYIAIGPSGEDFKVYNSSFTVFHGLDQ